MDETHAEKLIATIEAGFAGINSKLNEIKDAIEDLGAEYEDEDAPQQA